MIKERIMNNLYLTKILLIKKLSLLFCGAVFLSACAGNSIVKMESSVEQLKNLNDYDRDGVIEAREKCADTVLGATIDNYGCGTQTTYVDPLKVDIKFANNSYSILPSAFSKIQSLARALEQKPELKIFIEGHTSKVGSAQLNQTLSDNRAKAVLSALTNDLNIVAERVSFKGYGFERLIDFGDTEEAHAINRRIMVELSQTVSVDDMIWTIYTVDEVK
jgi:OOP family OmpA-OmpF porin